jgi:tetratricopeptide (TPR) repeat protein
MPEATYTFAAVAKILEIAESKLRYWAQVGFVGPSVRESGRMLFSFQDLISVKAAKELVDRGFAVAHIRKALSSVRSSLPHVDRPLDRIRVAFDGETLVLVDEGAAFELSGQKVFDFGLGDLAVRAAVGTFEPSRRAGQGADSASAHGGEGKAGASTGAVSRPATAYEWFTEALRLEGDPARLEEAEVCYRRALTLDPALAAAHNNLGQIAYRRGDTRAARAAFDNALTLDPDQPEARFNLANLILEAGDIELAVAELKRALQVAPDFADAHYNLAVALERLGGQAQARAHLERYLALDGEAGAPWASQARVLIERLSE